MTQQLLDSLAINLVQNFSFTHNCQFLRSSQFCYLVCIFLIPAIKIFGYFYFFFLLLLDCNRIKLDQMLNSPCSDTPHKIPSNLHKLEMYSCAAAGHIMYSLWPRGKLQLQHLEEEEEEEDNILQLVASAIRGKKTRWTKNEDAFMQKPSVWSPFDASDLSWS